MREWPDSGAPGLLIWKYVKIPHIILATLIKSIFNLSLTGTKTLQIAYKVMKFCQWIIFKTLFTRLCEEKDKNLFIGIPTITMSYYAVAIWLLCSCYAVALRLLCGWYAVAMRLLWGCYEVAMRLLWGCSCSQLIGSEWTVNENSTKACND